MNFLMCCTISFLILSIIACTTQQVSYQLDIEPILSNKCIKCHTPPNGIGYKKTGLMMISYESLMKGTAYGPVIVPGDSQTSIINMMAEGRIDNLRKIMHTEEKTLNNEEIMLLNLWVNQGALHN